MTDCSNAEIRDLLPDLLHERLAGAERELVQEHLRACASCRAELDLLVIARHSVRAPSIDAERVLVGIPPYRAPSRWAKVTQSNWLRAAAAVVIVAGGMSVALARGGGDRPTTLIDATRGSTTSTTSASELAVGEPVGDLTDSELNALIEELPQIDAITPAESDVELPTIEGGA